MVYSGEVVLNKKKENEVMITERTSKGNETRYMCFLNCCINKSTEVLPCFTVWAASRGEE